MIKNMKIAVQLYSVRDDAEKDFEGVLRQIKKMGYEGVEFAGLYGKHPEDVKALLDELELTPVSAHVGIAELNADPASCIEIYKGIGCPYIAIPWLGENDRPGNPGYNKIKENIAKAVAECNKYGITLLYHNHDFEFVKINGQYALDLLYKEIPALQTELDTCWVKVAGEDPAAYIKKYAGRCPVVHLKDFTLSGEKPEHMYGLIGVDNPAVEKESGFAFRPVGYGMQDMPSIIKAAEESGTKWLVVEQDESNDRPAIESVKMSLHYLTRNFI